MSSEKIEVDREALEKVLEYLWHDEQHHFFECFSDGKQIQQDHIFLPIVKLQAAIDGVSPEHLLKDSFGENDETCPPELSLT